MKRQNMMPIQVEQEQIWTLSEDRTMVRFVLPPLPIKGLPQQAEVAMAFSARAVDAIIERLTILRAQMLPAPPKPGSRN